MFQTVGHHAIDMYAEAMEIPLYRRTIEGSSVAQEKDYRETAEDEVEDLYALLKQVKVGANLDYFYLCELCGLQTEYQDVFVSMVNVQFYEFPRWMPYSLY